jgi:hypothetical protein
VKRIGIHGVPRSGTTWLGSIFDSSSIVNYFFQPLYSYAFKNRLTASSSLADIEHFFHDISKSNDDFGRQELAKRNGNVPVFSKKNQEEIIVYKEVRYHHLISHMLRTDEELFMVLIVRNPLSVLASWVKAPKEFDSETMNLEKEWRKAECKNEGREENYYGFDKWREFALMAEDLSSRFPDRCMIIDYCELLSNSEKVISNCFAFCGIPLEKQSLGFIAQSKASDLSSDAYSVYRVKQNDKKWKGILPPTIVDDVTQELKGTVLEKYLHESH